MSDCCITAKVTQQTISATIVQQTIVATFSAPRGAPGPAGPPGPSGGETISKTALQDISGHRAVKVAAGGVEYPSIDNAGDGDLLLGITTGAASVGADATVQVAGEMTEPSWSWSLGPVFSADAGVLTQTPPAGAWLRQVGIATGPTTLFVDMRPPILTLTE